MALDGVEETWWVKVAGRAYGPYTSLQMARFVAEGRVTGSSLVSLFSDSGWSQARHCAALQNALNEAHPPAQSEKAGDPEVRVANLLVYADFRSGASRRFEFELRRLGRVAEAAPNLWLVRSRQTAGVLRNALSQMLERGDKVLVIDATRDRLAWFNMGPEAEARLREVWNSDLPDALG